MEDKQFDEKRWRQQGRIAIGLIIISAVFAVVMASLGTFTDWSYDITPWFDTSNLINYIRN